MHPTEGLLVAQLYGVAAWQEALKALLALSCSCELCSGLLCTPLAKKQSMAHIYLLSAAYTCMFYHRSKKGGKGGDDEEDDAEDDEE